MLIVGPRKSVFKPPIAAPVTESESLNRTYVSIFGNSSFAPSIHSLAEYTPARNNRRGFLAEDSRPLGIRQVKSKSAYSHSAETQITRQVQIMWGCVR